MRAQSSTKTDDYCRPKALGTRLCLSDPVQPAARYEVQIAVQILRLKWLFHASADTERGISADVRRLQICTKRHCLSFGTAQACNCTDLRQADRYPAVAALCLGSDAFSGRRHTEQSPQKLHWYAQQAKQEI